MKLVECQMRLFGYCDRELEIRRKFPASINSNGTTVNTDIVVVARKGHCLPGTSTAKAFGILWTGPLIARADRKHHKKPRICYRRTPACSSRDLFTGKLCDFQLELHVDESVMPVAQKPRRIPFALQLREKVSDKIKELIAKDLNE